MRCYISGTGAIFGRSHTHHKGVAGGRWIKRAVKTQRVFKPNLQKVTILENGVTKRVFVTTKVIKRVKKDLIDGVKPNVTIPHLEKAFAAKANAQKTA
jgi:ribosomal protein L28